MRKCQSFTPVRQPYQRPVTEVFNTDLQPLAAGSPLYVLGGWVVDPNDSNPWENSPIEIEGVIDEEEDEIGGSSLGGWVVSNVNPWE